MYSLAQDGQTMSMANQPTGQHAACQSVFLGALG
jgi:hypothetical protein